MLRILECFAGIGACSKALTNLGIKHEIVDAVEIDKYAIKSFNAIHGTNFEPQDITKWDKDVECDLIMHGSPCQDFSVAGKQAGGDKDSGTRSSLMYETLRIVEKIKPKYVIWENVKNILSKKHRHNFDAYLEAMEKLGYKSYYQVLNAKHYGVPQNRERVFTVSILENKVVFDDYNSNIRVDQDTIGTLTTNCGAQASRNGWKIIEEKINFEFPEGKPLDKRLRDVLENTVDEKYYLSDKTLQCFLSDGTGNYPRRERFLQNLNRKNQDVGNSVTTRAGSRPTDNYVRIVDDTFGFDRQPRVYGESSPTLRAGRQGLKVAEPFIVASRGRNPNNPSDRTNGHATKQMLEPNTKGLCNTLTSVQKDNYVAVRVANSQGVLDGMRIRKLTPKECWRLMGFDDEDFEKAKKVNSDTQLYKQAGNSIVVNVLEAILKNLIKEEYDK